MRMKDDDRAMISSLLVEGLRPTTISEELGVDPKAVSEVAAERESLDTFSTRDYMAARQKMIDGLDIRITGSPPKALVSAAGRDADPVVASYGEPDIVVRGGGDRAGSDSGRDRGQGQNR